MNNPMSRKLSALVAWIDQRLPIVSTWKKHMSEYHVPKNLNIWYIFGVLSLLVLANQIITGIWLAMNYVPHPDHAMQSVETIMRDVNYGWLIRYMHSVGSSMMFVVIYLHMFKSLIYGSYRKPRELVWLFGMSIYLCLMAEAFFGYVLPWGQMSYWGAQVITSLFESIPLIGQSVVEWVRGDYSLSGITLNRFYAFHVIAIPLLIVFIVRLHLSALHTVGSNNPDGIDIKKNLDEKGIPVDSVPMHPYYTVRDLLGVVVFLFVFFAIVFISPEMGGLFLEPANFEPANPLKMPDSIEPVWYFAPFYSMLRAVTFSINEVFNAKFLGVLVIAGSLALLTVLPWLDRSSRYSIRYKGWLSKTFLMLLIVSVLILGVLGTQGATPKRSMLAQLFTASYFAFFMLMPIWSQQQAAGLLKILRIPLPWMFAVLFVLLSIQGMWNGEQSASDVFKQSIWIRLIGLSLAIFFLLVPFLIAKDKVKALPDRLTMNGGFNVLQVLGTLLLIALLVGLPLAAAASEDTKNCGMIECERFINPSIDPSKNAPMSSEQRKERQLDSLQRGLRHYTENCLSCHSLKYTNLQRIADDLRIPEDIAKQYLLPANRQLSDPLSALIDQTQLSLDSKELDSKAPDLSSFVRTKKAGEAWVFTYLQSFYQDNTQPTGTNNLVSPNVNMVHVLSALQGQQKCVQSGDKHQARCTQIAMIEGQEGSLSEAEYQQMSYDIAHFLGYIANPIKEKSHRMGAFVLSLLALLMVLVFILNREYWKDIH